MSSSHESPGEVPPPATPIPSTSSPGSQNRSSFSERLGSAASFGAMPSKEVFFKFPPAGKVSAPAAPHKPTQPHAHSRHADPAISRSAFSNSSSNSKNASRSTNQGRSSAYSQVNKPILDRATNKQVALENLLGTSDQRRAAPLPPLGRSLGFGAAAPPMLFQEKQPSIWAAQRSDSVSADSSRPSSGQEEAMQMEVDPAPEMETENIQDGEKSSGAVERENQPPPTPVNRPGASATTHTSRRPSPFAFNDQARSEVRKRGNESMATAYEEEPRRHKVPAVAQQSPAAARRPATANHGAAYMPPQSRATSSARDLRSEQAAPAHRAPRPAEAGAPAKSSFFGIPDSNDEDASMHVDDIDVEVEAKRRIQSELVSLKKHASVKSELEIQVS